MIKFNSKEENDEKIIFEELIEIKKLNEMKKGSYKGNLKEFIKEI